jgi:hypothetical protein
MFRSLALIPFIFSAILLGACAGPVPHNPPRMTLAFATRFNKVGGANILAADQARARALTSKSSARHAKRSSSFPITNVAVSINAQ